MPATQPAHYVLKDLEVRGQKAYDERDRLQRELLEAKRSLIVGAEDLAQTGSLELALELSALPVRIATLCGLYTKAQKEAQKAMDAYREAFRSSL